VVPLELVGVRVEVPANTPMVLLREQAGRQRLLPIYIGTPEATSIHYALEGVTPPRPLTHDLFIQTLQQLGVSLQQIVVTEMRDHTYFAELHLRRAEGDVTVLSSRPSDAIALAARTGTPIFAEDEVLDEVGYAVREEQQPEEEVVEEFKQFLDEINPDDFAS
jgi:uncharacterized protein